MNRPVAPLSNNAFTAISSWLSNFSNPTFNQTSLNGRSVRHMSLTLSVDYYMVGEEEDTEERGKRDGTKIGIDGKIPRDEET